jgi:5-methylcytosine-specific restriction endonuclease McrA
VAEIVTWSQARELGLQDYFTGKPCKRGHVSARTFSSGMCKQCAREKSSEYFCANKEKINENRTARTARNPEVSRAKKNAYRVKNIGRVIEIERRALAKVLAKDPDRYRRRATQWQKDNPDKVRARFARRRAREAAADGSFTAGDVMALFEKQSGKCIYCPLDLGKGYHVDHIVPLVRGGSNWPSNLQLCCPTCNISKGSKDHDEFVRYLSRAA